jgi:hypothetical protein
MEIEPQIQQRSDEPQLGHLERVSPRSVWVHEERDFTPWLLRHAAELGEALGIDLELDAAERPVGPFELDLIGTDLTNGRVLIVENQLERTDHRHLGQLVTYAAGTDAATIVWIATRFEEQHRQAIDWLNERTDEETRFFGVELEALRIGDSQPAPHFKLAATPNDWQKVARTAARTTRSTPTGKRAAYAEFWSKAIARIAVERPGWTQRRELVGNAESWLGFPSSIPGARLHMSFVGRPARLRHELYFQGGSPEENQAAYDAILARRDELVAAYGAELTFGTLGVTARIAADGPEADVTDTQRHDDYIDWFVDSGDHWRRAIAALT